MDSIIEVITALREEMGVLVVGLALYGLLALLTCAALAVLMHG